MLIFRQLFDPQSSTYTYLLADSESREAILIDPVFEQVRREAALIDELDLNLVATVETHVHADHVTGGWLLRDRFGSKMAISEAGGAEGADIYLKDGDTIAFGARHIEARSTPGHTNGCMTFVLDNHHAAFTGDCLLIRGCGRTDFQQGSAATMYQSVHNKIFSLPEDCLLYPGHDYKGSTVTSVGEERQFNPRLGGDIGEGDFAGYMENLNLAHPKQIDVAVPANLKSGKPEGGIMPEAAPDWAPLTYTYAGVWEVQPQWLEENLDKVQLIDVRQTDEFNGVLGHIPGAKLVPLGELVDKSGALDKDKPIVAVCRSGSRSAQATVLLGKEGFTDVANLAGGMLRWQAQRLPVEGLQGEA